MDPAPPAATFYLVWYCTRGSAPHWELQQLMYKTQDEALARVRFLSERMGFTAKVVKVSL
jgi:hypothetical protein